jgi:predicted alpha/beta-fold hydrolase
MELGACDQSASAINTLNKITKPVIILASRPPIKETALLNANIS